MFENEICRPSDFMLPLTSTYSSLHKNECCLNYANNTSNLIREHAYDKISRIIDDQPRAIYTYQNLSPHFIDDEVAVFSYSETQLPIKLGIKKLSEFK